MHCAQYSRLAFLLLILLPLHQAGAAIRLASVFSDNMVLQRDQPLRVWGEADPNATIEVTLAADHQTTTADKDGHWSVTLPARKATLDPQSLNVSSNKQEAALHNILIGDVWLCAGQSNMQMTLAETETGPEEARDTARQNRIRLLTIPKHPSAKPESLFDAKWRECTPDLAGKFSAVGYYFGRSLTSDPALESVPVGLIDCSFGGTAAEAWTAKEKLGDFKSNDLLPSMFGIAPGQIYNGMVYALAPLNLKGVLWYQGESNAAKPELYPHILSTMIADWRGRFDNADLPFFLVQLPAFTDSKFIWIREAEAQVARDVPHVALAVTYDTTDGYDLHPKQKREIGRRLSLLARQAAYKESLTAAGPTFKSAVAEGESLRITFDTDGQGLASAPGSPRGFALAGEDNVFYFADTKIDGDQVVLHSDSVPAPKFVRYAWAALPDATLTNKAGLPVAPFRTDALPREITEVQKQPVSRQVSTGAYQLEIDGNGRISSLIVKNRQFLSNSPGAAGGTSIPALFGPRSLPNIRQLGPNTLSCSDNEITLLLKFDSDAMTWSISNRSKSIIQFHIALASRVTAGSYQDPQTPLSLKSGNASIAVTGIDKVSKSEDGPILEVTVKPAATRDLRFQPGR